MQDVQEAKFLDLIYAAAVDQGLWPQAIAEFAALLNCKTGFLSSFDIITHDGPAILSEECPEAVEKYSSHYSGINPFIRHPDPAQYLRNWSLEILTDEDIIAREDYVKTEYYNDFSLLYEANGVLFIRLGLTDYQPHVLNINLPVGREAFETADLELADRLHPHLVRAFDLSRKFAVGHAGVAPVGELFDTSRYALFMVSADADLVRVNPAGEALLRRRQGISVRGGRLRASRPDAARRLDGLIAAAATGAEPSRAGGSMVIAVGDRSLPLSVAVAPVRSPAHPLFQNGPHALVCVSDPARRLVVSEQRLCEVLGLTPGEARMARALLNRGDVPRAAASLGISVHTAKTHMVRIHQKTGTDRQVTLAELILRCAAPASHQRLVVTDETPVP
jgi:DNA-binding CsgD family transcriptional regulator/PAS domain-containing protein